MPGVGLQVPLLIPALTALLIGLTFSGNVGISASVTAMVSGIFGVLIGGNLAQLGKIKDLEYPCSKSRRFRDLWRRAVLLYSSCSYRVKGRKLSLFVNCR